MTQAKKINKSKLTPLKNINIARVYLNAILHYNPNNTEQFILGLKNIITAQGGQAKLAKKMKLSTKKLNKTLAETDPNIFEVLNILKALNLNIYVKSAENCSGQHAKTTAKKAKVTKGKNSNKNQANSRK